MCGRFTQAMPWSELVRLYRITEPKAAPNLPARYNIAPSQQVPVVRPAAEGDGRALVQLRWGLIPFWAKDAKIGYKMINARAETVATSGAFKHAFRKRRCLVPADGFYEWKKSADKKTRQPYRITMADGEPFAMAGLWERWTPKDSGDPVESFTIVTTDANDLVAPIHDRMPAILDTNAYDRWLTPAEGGDAADLLRPFPAARMTAYPVSTRVNSPKTDEASLIVPLEETPAQARLL